MKYQIVPIQAHQIDLISKRIAFFNQLSKHFRQEFIEQNVCKNIRIIGSMRLKSNFLLLFVNFASFSAYHV